MNVFTAPSFRDFRTIEAGWVQCLGRHTITAVALASGAVRTAAWDGPERLHEAVLAAVASAIALTMSDQ